MQVVVWYKGTLEVAINKREDYVIGEYMLVYDGLEEWLNKNGMSETELAKKIGSENILSRILRRSRGTQTFTVNKICEVTGLPVEKLVRWVPEDTEDIGKSYRENEVYFDKLFELIKSRKTSINKTEREVGLSINFFHQLNTKRRKGVKLSIKTLKALAEYFNVEPTDLFEISSGEEVVEEAVYEKTWEDIYNESDVSMDKMFALMDKKGLTKNDVVRKSGVTWMSIFNRLNNGKKISAMSIRKIADALGVQPTDLYEVVGC